MFRHHPLPMQWSSLNQDEHACSLNGRLANDSSIKSINFIASMELVLFRSLEYLEIDFYSKAPTCWCRFLWLVLFFASFSVFLPQPWNAEELQIYHWFWFTFLEPTRKANVFMCVLVRLCVFLIVHNGMFARMWESSYDRVRECLAMRVCTCLHLFGLCACVYC